MRTQENRSVSSLFHPFLSRERSWSKQQVQHRNPFFENRTPHVTDRSLFFLSLFLFMSNLSCVLALSNPNAISSTVTESVSSLKFDIKPAPLSSVEALLHGSTTDPADPSHADHQSPIAQVRSSVEKQMNQLQQELLHGFNHSTPAQEIKRVSSPFSWSSSSSSSSSLQDPRPVTIPVDLTHAAIPRTNASTPDRAPSIKTVPPQDLNPPVRPTSGSSKRTVHDVPVAPVPSPSRPTNELKITLSSPFPNQIQEKIPAQRMSRCVFPSSSPFLLHAFPFVLLANKFIQRWIKRPNRRSSKIDRGLPKSNDELWSTFHSIRTETRAVTRHRHRRKQQRRWKCPLHLVRLLPVNCRCFTTAINPRRRLINTITAIRALPSSIVRPNDVQPHRNTTRKTNNDRPIFLLKRADLTFRKSPIRTTINSNNNRVLSVSGKLRCSRCQDELGQGSAMVIESLGLYYHIECFRCFVCNIPLSSSFEGTDVRVRNNRLHCQNCFSDDNGKFNGEAEEERRNNQLIDDLFHCQRLI